MIDPGLDDRAALRALVAKDQIRDLVQRYALAVDDHDIGTVLQLFDTDAVFEVAGEELRGREEIRPFFVSAMDRYHTMLHTPEIHLVDLDGDGIAAGTMTGHAELAVHDTLMITAYRYRDRYAHRDGRWVFTRRAVSFMYALPLESMASSFRSTRRIRWPQSRYADADYPETAPTWDTYH